MPTPPVTHVERAEALRLAAVWASVVLGPLLWLSALTLCYLWVEARCDSASGAALLAILALGALATALAGVLGFRQWQRSRVDDEGPTSARRQERFLALSGIALSAFSFALFLSLALPVLLHTPCADGAATPRTAGRRAKRARTSGGRGAIYCCARRAERFRETPPAPLPSGTLENAGHVDSLSG
jgi:hypothetical protein